MVQSAYVALYKAAMNVNEDGHWPHGWHSLDGDRCIKCDTLTQCMLGYTPGTYTPLGRYTPPGQGTPPALVHTSPGQVHTSPGQVHPLAGTPFGQVNLPPSHPRRSLQQMVWILLECFLVSPCYFVRRHLPPKMHNTSLLIFTLRFQST